MIVRVGDIECEIAIGAFVVLPSTVGFLERVIGERFDSVTQRTGVAICFCLAPAGPRDLDGVGRNVGVGVARIGGDVLDLAAIAIAVEMHNDLCNRRCGERIEERGLVTGAHSFAQLAEGAALGKYIDGFLGELAMIVCHGVLQRKEPGTMAGLEVDGMGGRAIRRLGPLRHPQGRLAAPRARPLRLANR